MTRNRFGKVIIIASLLAALATVFSALSVFSQFRVYAAGNPGSISSAADLIRFAHDFNSGAYDDDCVVNVAMTNGTFIDLSSSNFEGIGNAAHPFRGKVVFADGALDVIAAGRAIFGCITPAAEIVDHTGSPLTIIVKRSAADSVAPLFADKVVIDPSDANAVADWRIVLENDDVTDPGEDNIFARPFSGVVSEIGAGCKVSVTFTHNSIREIGAEVTGTADCGTICGKLGEGAELTVDLTASVEYNVTSSSGNAGGIVGKMENGSKLTLADDFTSHGNVTSGSQYAGSLVGSALNAVIDLNGNTVTMSKTVTGALGSGGVFGYYKYNGSDPTRTFDLTGYNSDTGFVLSSAKISGGFIGKLESEKNIVVTDTESAGTYGKNVRFSGSSDSRGGVIGEYSNTAFANTLDIHNVEVMISADEGNKAGGAVGRFVGNVPVYVKIKDFTCNVSDGKIAAGLVANMGDKGSFVDLYDSTPGTVTVIGSCKSGLIHNMQKGVLRIHGTTDLSAAANDTAQLVGTRGDGLVYALGSGNDAGWTFKRGSSAYDDIGDWGEVVRTANESELFTVDGSAHTVTVKPHVASMASASDVVRTALNMQLNGGEDVGALCFENKTGSEKETLLGSTLSLASGSTDIDLAGTGIISFTRDDGSGNPFSGTFNGNGGTIRLAIGENYGYGVSAAGTKGDNNMGRIYRHRYPGLFAKINGGTVNDLTLDGFISVKPSSGDYYIGGIAGAATGPFTLNNVTTQQTGDNYQVGGSTSFGGAVGSIINYETATGTNITNCKFNSKLNDKNGEGAVYGGVIGSVKTTNLLTINVSSTELGGTFENSSAHGVKYGGLIGQISENNQNNNHIFNRTVNITNVTVTNSAVIKSKVSNGTDAGAFLGWEWLDTQVTIGTGGTNGLTIGGSGTGNWPKLEVTNGGANIGALVCNATGYWQVNNVKVNKAVVSAQNSSKFGFMVYDATRSDSALYLELKGLSGQGNAYDLSGLDCTSASFSVYDEIVADTRTNNNSIENNNNAVVSIKTTGSGVIMNGTNCNTYQNQKNYAPAVNPNTRYYYNLDTIRENNNNSDGSPGEKLLLWSLNTYAHSSLKSKNYFNGGFDNNNFSGNMDMEGLSYYPVNYNGNVTISAGSTIKFYNQQIENGERGTGNSDSTARSTRSGTKSQHYLMHEGMFLNYTGNLTVNGLTVAGNISNSGSNSGNESGFIVRRKFGDASVTSEANLKNIVLAGAEIADRAARSYAPLLMNTVGQNVKLSFDGVSAKTSGDGDKYDPTDTLTVASSLVGDVGYSTATNINLSFSRMKLDSRTVANSHGLNNAYGTHRSLFDRATFLESFRFLSGGIGVYNYEYAEDWGSGTPHGVTYAKEISESVEFSGRQINYYDHYQDTTAGYYTHPEGDGNAPYVFSSGFLPHVCHAYDENNKYHEIMVNIKQEDLTSGCGQYNDPYEITDGGMLVTAAKIIYGNPDNNIEICLPTDLGTSSLDMWCASCSAHAIYKYADGSFKNTSNNSDTKTLAQVREYLAGAYYLIKNSVEIPAGESFVGFGAVNDGSSTVFENPYAFRGVIVGGENIHITNNSANPLVKTANGCVLKDIYIDVEGSIVISLNDNKLKFRYDNGGSKFYGGAIGQVMGGDNIIDHVQINFDNASITADGTSYTKLVPIGGYVGVVVNGGVIFRNMSGDGDIDGLPATVWEHVAESDTAWLYSNPIIGRVLSGYAFTESSSYEYDYTAVTMKNGRNNYSIPDLNSGSDRNKISVTASGIDKHVITVPDGQSLYLLGCIVNSGAGSATYNASSEQAYNAITVSNSGTPWSAYRKYTSTRCAEYSSVGKIVAANGDGTDDYVTVRDMDKYSSAVKVPYIIYKYTNKDGSVYRARSICNGNEPAVSQINFASGNFYLPASFRGLGSLYWDSPYLRLQFKSLDGKNAKLIYSTYFLDYDMQDTKGINLNNYNDANSNRKEHDNYINMHHVGLGLFSQFYQVQPGSEDYIKDFSVSGKIFYDIVYYSDSDDNSYSSGSSIAYDWSKNKVDSVYNYSVLNVGGVIGSVYGAKNQDGSNTVTNTSTGSRKNVLQSQFKIKNVTIDGAEFEGAKSVGGLIGYVSHTKEENKNGLINREIVECGSTASGVKLIAGVNAGGLIGYLNRNVNITGAAGKTNLYIDSIRIKGTNTTNQGSNEGYDYISGEKVFCAGGLVGFADMKYGDKMVPTFSNYKIIGVGNKVNVYSENTSPEKHIYVGGVVGELKSASLKIQDVEISGLNLKATYSGGVLAAFFHDKSTTEKLTLTLENVTVDGGSGRSYIEGLRTAGGLLARNESTSTSSGVSYNSIESCVIKDYDIISSAPSCKTTSTYNSNWYIQAVGAVAGTSLTNNANGNTFNIHDLKVESCALSANWSVSSTSSDDNTKTVGAGGLFGMINKTFIKGSDILLDGTTVNYYKNAAATNDDPRVAGLIGNNRDGGNANSYVKLVAVSIQGCNDLTRLAGKKGTTGEVNFGTGGYVILADLRGAAAGSSPNTAFATPVSAGSEIANPARSPYVHVNPIFDIGTSDLKLTGDGIAPAELSLPLHTLMNDDWRYKYALSGSNKEDFNTYLGSKLSTFNKEQGTDIANDFAVLVVDDLSRNNVTDMINAYINLVANDNRTLSATHLGGYADDVTNVYTVQIYKYEWNGSKFVKKTGDAGEANLKRKENQFFMVSGDIDTSETKTFSLIDVQYYDPVSTTKIAYHLYIPVIVRKLLVFDFEIATGSGTNYQRSWYDDRFGKALMENMGTPVSIFFKYNYLRSKSDWEDAINAGDNLLGNFEKKLDFNTSAKLDADTVLVLVDPNDGGKPYYARYGDVFGNGTNGTFSLSSFKENLDGTGASFKSVSLCDLLDLRYVTDPSGLFVEDVQANATVKAKNSSGSVEAYFRLKTEIDTGPYYSISVNKTDESYTYDQNKSSYIVKLDESYYISFFTSKDDVSEKLHRYVFSSPSSIKDPDNPTPTRKVHNSYRERTDNAYLFMGSIFVQSDFAVKELTVNPLMAVDSHPADLDVYMRSTISIASDIYSGIRAYLSAMTDGEYNIKVYQSFILNLTRHESDSVMHKVFIDSADPSANVRINYASPGYDTGSASDYSVPCTVYPNGSYAEIRYDQPLNPYLIADELACTPAVVETRINVEYDSDDKLREQFPIRNDVEDNTKGTTVSGSSNVAYDPARTAYSKSTISGSDPIGKKYYCLLDEKKARLEYNVDIDFYDGDYDPLGINPLDYHDNQLAFSISTRAVYNLDEIYDKTVDYDMIRCTVKLYCKNDPTPYSVALSFPDYMETGSGVYLNNVAGATKSMNPADNYTTLVFTAPRSSILDISRDSTGRALEIPITYTIYTGKSETAGAVTFESQDHVYSNYKIYLEVELYKSSTPTDVLTSSKANDYLIYTNARIIPDFIDELS